MGITDVVGFLFFQATVLVCLSIWCLGGEREKERERERRELYFLHTRLLFRRILRLLNLSSSHAKYKKIIC